MWSPEVQPGQVSWWREKGSGDYEDSKSLELLLWPEGVSQASWEGSVGGGWSGHEQEYKAQWITSIIRFLTASHCSCLLNLPNQMTIGHHYLHSGDKEAKIQKSLNSFTNMIQLVKSGVGWNHNDHLELHPPSTLLNRLHLSGILDVQEMR